MKPAHAGRDIFWVIFFVFWAVCNPYIGGGVFAGMVVMKLFHIMDKLNEGAKP